jgi:hypothetical protein
LKRARCVVVIHVGAVSLERRWIGGIEEEEGKEKCDMVGEEEEECLVADGVDLVACRPLRTNWACRTWSARLYEPATPLLQFWLRFFLSVPSYRSLFDSGAACRKRARAWTNVSRS